LADNVRLTGAIISGGMQTLDGILMKVAVRTSVADAIVTICFDHSETDSNVIQPTERPILWGFLEFR
jgi:hypothetical protein